MTIEIAEPVDDPERVPLEQVTQQFVESLVDRPAIHTLSPEDARSVLVAMQSGPIGQPGVHAEDFVLPVGPTGSVAVRIVRPTSNAEIVPAIMYFHGGGWILGDRMTHDRLVREIAVGAGAAVVFVEYARAPEARYPTAVEQAYAATRYVADNGPALRIDPLRLAVAGDSAGGNLAAAVTLLAKERRGPKIEFQALLFPVVAADFDTQSYMTFAEGPWLTKAVMKWFWDAYLPEPMSRSQIMATPLNAT